MRHTARTKPLSQEYRIYLALWRKAELSKDSGQPVTFRASNKSVAVSIRSGMYKAIRPYRLGTDHDEVLSAAAEHFVVSAINQPDGTCTIMLKPRLSMSELELQLEALGLTDDDLLLPEERAAELDLEKLLASASAPAPTRSTPFYTRED